MDTIGNMLIRADAGPPFGSGHALRCISLATDWIRMGGRVDFAGGRLPATLRRKIHGLGFGLIECKDSGNPFLESGVINQLIAERQPDFLILDGERFDHSFQSRLHLSGTRLMVIESGNQYPERPEPRIANIVLRQSIESCHNEGFENTAHPIVLTGPNYVLPISNRPRFRKQETSPIPPMAERILVYCNARNAAKNIARVLAAVDGLASTRISVDVILGNRSWKSAGIQFSVSECRHGIRVHKNADRLPSLIRQADLAVTDLDSVCLPLVYHGVPTIFFDSRPPRQSDSCQAMIRTRDDLPESGLTELIVDAICDQELRNQLAKNALALIDGNGAERIVRRLAVLQFRFRSANMDDAELLHRWRNDPEARANCFQTECVPIETHRQWLKAKLGSNNSDIQMIEDRNSHSVGSLWVDYDRKSKQAELNIHIIPSLRGCGLGTAFVESTCGEVIAKHPEYQIIARIKSGNLISQSAFRKAGFRKVASTTINGQVAIHYAYVNEQQGHRTESGLVNRQDRIGTRRQAS